MKSGANLETR